MSTTAFAILTFLASGLSILIGDPAKMVDISYLLIHTGAVGAVIFLIDCFVSSDSCGS